MKHSKCGRYHTELSCVYWHFNRNKCEKIILAYRSIWRWNLNKLMQHREFSRHNLLVFGMKNNNQWPFYAVREWNQQFLCSNPLNNPNANKIRVKCVNPISPKNKQTPVIIFWWLFFNLRNSPSQARDLCNYLLFVIIVRYSSGCQVKMIRIKSNFQVNRKKSNHFGPQ